MSAATANPTSKALLSDAHLGEVGRVRRLARAAPEDGLKALFRRSVT